MPSTEVSPLAQKYSGVVINQNQPPGPDDYVIVDDNLWRFQDFFLPSDYVRGSGEEASVPMLSGFHLCVGVADGYVDTASFDWQLEYYAFGTGWIKLIEGTAIGAPSSGEKVWVEALFKNPVDVSNLIDELEPIRFRVGFRFPVAYEAPKDVLVDYTPATRTVVIDSRQYDNILLADDVITPIVANGSPGFLTWDSQTAQATFSYQQGIHNVWLSAPNPLADKGCRVTDADENPITVNTYEASAMFRVLACSADSGTDLFGNIYRSSLTSMPVSQVAPTSDSNSSWLSKPNPSRFAVESMCFDMRDNLGAAVTLDGVVIDPTTPGLWANVYFSDDGEPGRSDDDWDQKLWTRVQKNWKIDKRQECVFPEPVVAKYIKIEFTHLQARHYSAGRFARPVRYKKHPKWVLDYFLVRLSDSISQTNKNASNSVAVVYDALDLAYNYYLDDINQAPDSPIEADPSFNSQFSTFINDKSDLSDQMDIEMLDKISYIMAPFKKDVLSFGDPDSLLSTVLRVNATSGSDGTTEGAPMSLPNTQALESLSNQPVAFEQDYPVMFFYLQCRHAYREVYSGFDYDKAYFAGIREIAFTRDEYQNQRDMDTYIELGGDLVNTERNDFTIGNLGRAGRSIGDLGVAYFRVGSGRVPAELTNNEVDNPNDVYPNDFYPGDTTYPNE